MTLAGTQLSFFWKSTFLPNHCTRSHRAEAPVVLKLPAGGAGAPPRRRQTRFLPECEKMSDSVGGTEEEETRETPSEAELRCESER